jgi:hypothetical protein
MARAVCLRCNFAQAPLCSLVARLRYFEGQRGYGSRTKNPYSVGGSLGDRRCWKLVPALLVLVPFESCFESFGVARGSALGRHDA